MALAGLVQERAIDRHAKERKQKVCMSIDTCCARSPHFLISKKQGEHASSAGV